MLGSLAMAGGSLVSGLIKSGFQRKANREAQRDAREHDIRMWNMQNEYNHPSAQMSRLQEAGLNPNMIYGTSPSSAVGTAGSLPDAKAPDQPYDFGDPLQEFSRYQNIAQSKAQVDNLRTQNTVLSQEALLKAAQRANTMMQTSKSSFDLGVAKELRDTSLEAAKEDLRNLKLNSFGRELDNSFKDATMADRIKDVYLGVQNAKATLKGTNLSNELKTLERDLKQLGIEKNDPWYFRIFGRNVDELMDFRESRKGKTNLDFWNN